MKKVISMGLLVALFMTGCSTLTPTAPTEQQIVQKEFDSAIYKYKYKIIGVSGKNSPDVIVRGEDGIVHHESLYEARIDEDVDKLEGAYLYVDYGVAEPAKFARTRLKWVKNN